MSTAEVQRESTRSGRYYVDPANASRRYPSVTTVIGSTTSKPQLVAWAAKLVAEYAVDRLAVIGQLLADDPEGGRAAAIDLVKRAADRRRDASADRGSAVHAVAEALALDQPVPVLSDDAAGYVDAFLAFITDFDAEILLTEAVVCSRRHGYAGTLDAIVALGNRGGRRLAIDLKTGNSVYGGEVALQLAAYAGADEVWLPMGGRAPLPDVDGTAVLHLHGDGTYRLLELDNSRARFTAFLTALALFTWTTGPGTKALRAAIRPPGPDGSVPVYLEDAARLGRCRLALEREGLLTLAELARRSEAELLAMPGVGPGAIVAVNAVLADHGLALREPLHLVTLDGA